MTRIGIIGLGNIGREHLDAFLAAEGCEVAAVADASPGVAKKLAAKHGVANAFEDPQALIDCTETDAVVVAVPNRFHEPLALATLAAGKHLLLEKPMALDAAGAKTIYRAAQASDRVVMLGHQWRRVWWGEAMRGRIATGDLGEIHHAKCGWLRRKGIPGWGTWFTRKDQSGGGPLIDIGVHMIDITLDLIGAPRPLSVAGATFAAFGPRKKGIGKWGTPDWGGYYDVEDFATALIRCEGGKVVTLDVSWAAHSDRNDVFVELLGEDGGLVYRGGDLRFLTERDDKTVDEVMPMPASAGEEKDPGRGAMSEEFLRCIAQSEAPRASAWTGLVNSLVLDAIYRSAESGREVEVDYSGVD